MIGGAIVITTSLGTCQLTKTTPVESAVEEPAVVEEPAEEVVEE